MGGQDGETCIWIGGVVISLSLQEGYALMRARGHRRTGLVIVMGSVHYSKCNGLNPRGAGFRICDQENIGRSCL